MGEIIAGLIEGAMEALFVPLMIWTGRKVLTLWTLKSNELVEFLTGLVAWVMISVTLITLLVWIGSHAGIAAKMFRTLAEEGISGLTAVEVGVEESFGQAAIFRREG